MPRSWRWSRGWMPRQIIACRRDCSQRWRPSADEWSGGSYRIAWTVMRLAELGNRRVAVWGFGREGRAALAALCERLPAQRFTLFCRPAEVEAARAFDAALEVVDGEPDAAALGQFEIVVKSPGISAYEPALLAAQAQGTRFTSGTALWFGENPNARVIAVTGTKGKSTTTALIAHLARSLGVRTALAGNIGLPLLDLDGRCADVWAIELSSFQTGEAGPVELGVIVSLGEEHLDWHGTRERYVADKLKLAEVSRTLLVDARAPLARRGRGRLPRRRADRRGTRAAAARRTQRTQRLRGAGRGRTARLRCTCRGRVAAYFQAAAAPPDVAGHARRHRMDRRFDQHHA